MGGNDRIDVAVVGLGGRGQNQMDFYMDIPGCRISALCDVNQAALERAQAKVAKKTGEATPKGYGDMKDVFADKKSTPCRCRCRTTGTRWRRSGPARRARTCTSKSPLRLPRPDPESGTVEIDMPKTEDTGLFARYIPFGDKRVLIVRRGTAVGHHYGLLQGHIVFGSYIVVREILNDQVHVLRIRHSACGSGLAWQRAGANVYLILVRRGRIASRRCLPACQRETVGVGTEASGSGGSRRSRRRLLGSPRSS